MHKIVRWVFTSDNWFARWLRADFEYVNSKIPRKIQERINRAEFDAAVCGTNPIPEYERIYEQLRMK